MSEAERAALQTVFAAPGGGVPFYGGVLFMRSVLELQGCGSLERDPDFLRAIGSGNASATAT